MSNLPPRSGILAGGNFIVDTVKTIDAWPEQDTLCSITNIARSNGGGPYNILKNISHLAPKIPRHACGLIGSDAEAQWLLTDCANANINTTQLHQHPGPTSSTDAMTVADSGRRTFFHARAANAFLEPNHFDFSQTNAKVFYLGYLLLLDSLDQLTQDQTGASQVLREAKKSGLITAVDCVSTPHPNFREIAIASLKETDIFFLNEIEAGYILHRKITPNTAPEALHELATINPSATIVLHTAEAAFAIAPNSSSVLSQPSIAFPDHLNQGATGAGDAFATGFLYGIHQDWPLEKSLHLAVSVAASSLTSPTPSDGILPLSQCLELETTYGFRK